MTSGFQGSGRRDESIFQGGAGPVATLIRGGTIVNHDSSRQADVLVQDGVVAAIGSGLDAAPSAEVIDAGGCFILPGGIDPHTHLEFGFMGTVTADDFEWGTKAALSGGTTMVIDFCIPGAGQSLLATYQDWRRKAEGGRPATTASTLRG